MALGSYTHDTSYHPYTPADGMTADFQKQPVHDQQGHIEATNERMAAQTLEAASESLKAAARLLEGTSQGEVLEYARAALQTARAEMYD